MAAVDYQKNSLGWQWEQGTRRMGEWWEQRFSRLGDADLPDLSQWSSPEWLARGLFALIVGGLVGWLGWHLWKLLRPQWQRWRQRQGFYGPGAMAAPHPSADQLMRQAQHFQRQGDYQAACRALYLGFLQWLADRPQPHQSSPQQPSRTDGEYGQLLEPEPQAAAGQVLLKTHERLCFSSAPVTEADYRACEEAYGRYTQGRAD